MEKGSNAEAGTASRADRGPTWSPGCLTDAMLDPEGRGRLGDIVCRAVAGETAVACVSHAAAVSDFIHAQYPGRSGSRGTGRTTTRSILLLAMNRRNISARAEGRLRVTRRLPEH